MNLKRWEENGSLFTACFAMFCYILAFGDANIFAKSSLGNGATAFLLPVNVFFSVRVVVRLASQYAPAVGWWLRGLLRWTSWWMIYLAGVAIVGNAIDSAIHAMHIRSNIPDALVSTLLSGTPSLLMIRQAIGEYRDTRRQFGSIAQAERAYYADSQKRPPKSRRP